MAKITVLGSGGWGMALALTALQNGCDVTLWSPFKEEVDTLREKRIIAGTESKIGDKKNG